MFLMVPLQTDLRLAQIPYVTLGIMLLCTIIYYFQYNNNYDIEQAAYTYCAGVYDPDLDEDSLDFFRVDRSTCEEDLVILHTMGGPATFGVQAYADYLAQGETHYSQAQIEEIYAYELGHYQRFAQDAPASLDALLMYYPDTFNPLRMISSALAHADVLHLLGNLLFFFAFAPALELLAGNKLRFIAFLIGIEIICDVTFSLVELASGSAIPSLGLSGVVMGMIGFSAWMMPHAKIRTWIWIIFYMRTLYIPAAWLAAWYIGWDMFELFFRTNDSGVNFVAHVAGGFAGYFLGRYLYRERRAHVQEELADAIDLARAERQDILGILSSYRGEQTRINGEKTLHQAGLACSRYLERLYRLITSGRTGEALMLALEDYDKHACDPQYYDALFEDIGKWKQGRVYLCMGRLLIDLHIENGNYARALATAQRCLDADPDFALGSATYLYPLARVAVQTHQYELAWRLIHSAARRYPDVDDLFALQRLEIELLAVHLDRNEEARTLLESLLPIAGEEERGKLLQMERGLGVTYGTENQ